MMRDRNLKIIEEYFCPKKLYFIFSKEEVILQNECLK